MLTTIEEIERCVLWIGSFAVLILNLLVNYDICRYLFRVI